MINLKLCRLTTINFTISLTHSRNYFTNMYQQTKYVYIPSLPPIWKKGKCSRLIVWAHMLNNQTRKSLGPSSSAPEDWRTEVFLDNHTEKQNVLNFNAIIIHLDGSSLEYYLKIISLKFNTGKLIFHLLWLQIHVFFQNKA